jgi:hypothetical protein
MLLSLFTLFGAIQQPTLFTTVGMPPERPQNPPKKIHPVNIRMDEETFAQVRAIALAEDRTVSNLINRIVREWLAARGKDTGA